MKSIIKPIIKNSLCVSVNPSGCKKYVNNKICYSKKIFKNKNFVKKNVLVLGSSSGYGFLSSVLLSYGYKYNVLNVFKEKEYSKNMHSAGWYNSFFLERKSSVNFYLKNLNLDVFSLESVNKVIKIIKDDFKKIDLLIYSIASPRYVNVFNNQVYKSSIKPIFKDLSLKELDINLNLIKKIIIKKATKIEIEDTKKVMGGFFWQLWIENLLKADVLNKNFKTLSYSYKSYSVFNKIYNNGTIGVAKKHILLTSKYIREILKKINGKSFVVYNEAILTQSSMVIPGISLYLAVLNELRKKANYNSECFFLEDLFNIINFKKKHKIFLDSFEKNRNIQKNIRLILNKINSKNFAQYFNIHEFKKEYFKIYGFY